MEKNHKSQEKKEWVYGTFERVEGLRAYVVEFSNEAIHLVESSRHNVNILTSKYWPDHLTIVRHYGPITADDLLNGIPKPPPRPPKAHPERYLAQFARDAGHKDIIVIGTDRKFHTQLLFCGGSAGGFSEDQYMLIPNRYAQQDPITGIWHEVDASEDPRVVHVEGKE